MISKEEIKKLADLARIEIEENELDELRGEMNAILDYVGQVSHVALQNEAMRDGFENSQIRNVMREDAEPTESGAHSKELISEFPASEKNYLKVKKIL